MSQHIFISYSTKDAEAGAAVCAALEAGGMSCWIAPRDIPPGGDWASAIVEAFGSVETVVLLLSARSDASPEVQKEINLAATRRLKIVTLRIENVVPRGSLDYHLSNCQYLDAFSGPLSSHLPKLVDALRNPDAAEHKLSAAPSAQIAADAERRALEDVNWALAELQHHAGPVRSGLIDNVFEPAIAHMKPMFAAGQTAMCERIYRRAAEGVLQVLAAVPIEASYALPAEMQKLGELLSKHLSIPGEDSADAASRADALHRLLVDFVDRVPLTESRSFARPATWVAAGLFLLVSILSLYFAYLHGTTTWEVIYARPFGPDNPRAGPYLEVARTLVILVMAFYLLEITLHSEYAQIMLDWRWNSWRRPFVGYFRVFWLFTAATMSWTLVDYHFNEAPRTLTTIADEYLQKRAAEKNLEWQPLSDDTSPTQLESEAEFLGKLTGSGLDLTDVQEIRAESRPDFTGHRTPYRSYLAYSWVNYVGFGVTMLVVTAFAVAGDARRLVDERLALYGVLTNGRMSDTEIDRAFSKFFNICFQHTQRYITILAWISGAIAFELMVTKGTLAPAGLIYEFLSSAVVGACTLIWIGVLIHFYEGAFQRVCAEKRRRRQLSDDWEGAWRTLKFLFKCFFNHSGGIFAALYIIPVLLHLRPWR